MLLYIPKTTFTPTLFSQDTHMREVLEARLRHVKVIYSRSQSPCEADADLNLQCLTPSPVLYLTLATPTVSSFLNLFLRFFK